ncbi:hypothetical protein BGZ61DRAFT_526748 [Ilyonectria robusta]|uniref:uncharacterized protein n=1 Tax=Ilyonectria robusta TaxID=1079257 RepID=UPI001E8E4A92|nr:uncharacterized protein BGZ61DRAFT_526748 [Ilyonectria robusta]KAH8735699.1 hypothetical protein BGZ61DRAFT_526748 [Ilyonectria robusta]
MARSLALLAVTGVAAVIAQSTTVNVFLPMYDAQDLEASIVAADSAKTTFAVNCPKDADSNDCGITEAQTFIYGPSTFYMSSSYSDSVYGSYVQEITCQFEPKKDLATCAVSVVEDVDSSTFASTSSIITSGYLDMLIPVTVTAGANKLVDSETASETGSETTAAAPASTTGSTAAATGSASGSESTSASGSDSAASTPTASDNAAGAMVTQNAVLAGAAVLVGGALLL